MYYLGYTNTKKIDRSLQLPLSLRVFNSVGTLYHEHVINSRLYPYSLETTLQGFGSCELSSLLFPNYL